MNKDFSKLLPNSKHASNYIAIFQWFLPSQRPKEEYIAPTLLLGKSKDRGSVNI